MLAFDPDVVRGFWAGLLSTPPEELDATAAAVASRITAPLLALHGAPPDAGYVRWLHDHVPTASLEVWDGLGHLLHLVAPARFAARLRAFFCSAP